MNLLKMALDKKISDEEIIENILKGEKELYEIIIRRYNQKLFRIAYSITGEDGVEDIMQQAYINAYRGLAKFKRGAKFSTWLTRILVNEALAYLKQRNRFISFDDNIE